jgi:RNA polymerase sigma factor (sigma-70 family)
MNEDAALLLRYVNEGSEESFRVLVQRHIDLVYGAAMRRTGGDPHRAAEISQQVFTSLARNARKLSRHPVLAAWLHVATRNAAHNLMNAEQRRRARESAAALDPALSAPQSAVPWENLQPVLDAAIDELREQDRAVVVMRFLEQKAFGDIGRILQISDDAARVRTARALDKLRVELRRRGIDSTAAALSAVIVAHPMLAAPSGLALKIAATSLASVSTAGAVATTGSFMIAKLLTTAAVSGLLAFWLGTNVHSADRAPAAKAVSVAPPVPTDTADLERDNQRLREENAALSADVARLLEASAQIAEVASPKPRSVTLGMPPWEIHNNVLNNLRQISAAVDQFNLTQKRPPASVDELVGRTRYIRQLRSVDGEDYSGISLGPGATLTVTTAGGITVSYTPGGLSSQAPMPAGLIALREEAKTLQVPVSNALKAYRDAHNGAPPPDERALVPYFSNPQDGGKYLDLMQREKEFWP